MLSFTPLSITTHTYSFASSLTRAAIINGSWLCVRWYSDLSQEWILIYLKYVNGLFHISKINLACALGIAFFFGSRWHKIRVTWATESAAWCCCCDYEQMNKIPKSIRTWNQVFTAQECTQLHIKLIIQIDPILPLPWILQNHSVIMIIFIFEVVHCLSTALLTILTNEFRQSRFSLHLQPLNLHQMFSTSR